MPAPLPHLSRRRFLEGVVVLTGAAALRPAVAWSEGSQIPAATREAIEASPLIYVSPLLRDGSESACHGEVWFVADGDDLMVVTDSKRWRSRCIGQGLDRARIWVGDFGVWTRSDGKYKTAPMLEANAATLARNDPAVERSLATFGGKYTDEWPKWGPRFRNGLADGSRVLIRYRPIA